ncbi:MAG: glutamyl-tRNA amidotransferase [Acidimicrobiia bacterium]
MTNSSNADGMRPQLKQALGAAMKARDTTAVAAFRSAIAALDNAEAVELSDAPAMQHGTIAGGVAGLGSGEVPRRALSDGQLADIVLAQVAAWRKAAIEYESSGHNDRAAQLEAEAAILSAFLADRTT